MAEFKVGDVVELKSGGPDMTVVSIGKDDSVDWSPSVTCKWFTNEAPMTQTDSFPVKALRISPQD